MLFSSCVKPIHVFCLWRISHVDRFFHAISMQIHCRSTSALDLHLIILANCYHARTINRTGWDDSLPNPKCYGEIGSTGDCYQPGLPTIPMVAKAKVTPPI
jgi:hypothetical protein